MSVGEYQSFEGPVGSGVTTINVSPDVTFRSYLADRPGHTPRLKAAELALDVSMTLPHPVVEVWPVFKDFNVWQGRFGFLWDRVPGDSEGAFVHLGNKSGANDLKYNLDGHVTRYIVRKVVPFRLIYQDSLPSPIENRDGVWTGRNIFSLGESNGSTKVDIFMEHTWCSETMGIEALRAEAKGVLDAGVEFWRNYFVPDLISAIESQSGIAA